MSIYEVKATRDDLARSRHGSREAPADLLERFSNVLSGQHQALILGVVSQLLLPPRACLLPPLLHLQQAPACRLPCGVDPVESRSERWTLPQNRSVPHFRHACSVSLITPARKFCAARDTRRTLRIRRCFDKGGSVVACNSDCLCMHPCCGNTAELMQCLVHANMTHAVHATRIWTATKGNSVIQRAHRRGSCSCAPCTFRMCAVTSSGTCMHWRKLAERSDGLPKKRVQSAAWHASSQGHSAPWASNPPSRSEFRSASRCPAWQPCTRTTQ